MRDIDLDTTDMSISDIVDLAETEPFRLRRGEADLAVFLPVDEYRALLERTGKPSPYHGVSKQDDQS